MMFFLEPPENSFRGKQEYRVFPPFPLITAMLSHPALVLMPLLAWVDGQTGQGTGAVENKFFVLTLPGWFFIHQPSLEVNLRHHLVKRFAGIGDWVGFSI